MAKENLKLPIDIARLVEAQWTQTFYGNKPGPPPGIEVLDELLTTCFFASLQREKGRDTKFNVALCDERNFSTKHPFRYSKFTFVNSTFRFTPHRPFNVHELVRLAPACDPDTTLILAQIRASNLEIWGVVDVGRESSIRFVMLDELRIRVFGSGDMQMTLHGATLCIFKSGIIHLEQGGLINEGCLYECFKETSFELCRVIKMHLGLPDWDSPVPERHVDAMIYFDALDRLISSMRQLGHGGCILMVPDLQFDPTKIGVTIKYQCRNDQSLAWMALKGLSSTLKCNIG